MQKSNFELEVLVNGKPVKEYLHDSKTYIEGRDGAKFSIRMRNHSNRRVLFVPSIDGLSIMDGKEASFSSRGYIVDPHNAITIEGWRVSDDKVAEFFFTSPDNAYAEKREKGENIGIIGSAVFEEDSPIYTYTHICHSRRCLYCGRWHGCCESCYWSHSYGTFTFSNTAGSINLNATATSGNSKMMAMSSKSMDGINQVSHQSKQELGTGFGQDVSSAVTAVSFNRKDEPSAVFQIFYNTRKQLEKIGVVFSSAKQVSLSAFPAQEGYCQRP